MPVRRACRGSDRSHYAPGTPLALVDGKDLGVAIEAALARSERVAVLARAASFVESDRVAWRRMPEAAVAYGRALYAALRALDASGADRILVEAVPTGEIWAAVADRLARASAGGDGGQGLSGP